MTTGPFNLRAGASLREAVEASAEQSGKSLNGEIVDRLERSFAEDDQNGGPEMRELLRVWHAAFLRGLGVGSRVMDQLADRSVSEQLAHPIPFRTAVHMATDALIAAGPKDYGPEDPEQARGFEEMLDHLTRQAARGMRVKLTAERVDK